MRKPLERAIFFISIPLSFVGFILPFYAKDAGASPVEVGVLFSIFSLVTVILRPLVGKYIDQHGRKGALLLGLAFYALVQGMLWLGSSYLTILFARVLQSIGSSFLWITAYTMVADTTEKGKYAQNYGSLQQASNQGDFLGSMIGFTLLFYLGNSSFSYIFALFFGFALYAILFGVQQIDETQKDQPDPTRATEEQVTTRFKIYITLLGFSALAGSMITPMFLIYIQEKLSVSIALVSIAYIPGAILRNILPRKIGHLTDRHGLKRFLLFGMLLEGLLIIFIPAVRTIEGFAMLNCALAFAGIVASPAQKALVAEMTHNNQFGRTHGYYQTAIGIGAFIGPLIGAYIYQHISVNWLFYINAVVTLLTAVAMQFLIDEKRLQPPTAAPTQGLESQEKSHSTDRIRINTRLTPCQHNNPYQISTKTKELEPTRGRLPESRLDLFNRSCRCGLSKNLS